MSEGEEIDSTFSQVQRVFKQAEVKAKKCKLCPEQAKEPEGRGSLRMSACPARQQWYGKAKQYFALEKMVMNERRMQLKICEGCGRIWLRDQGINRVYCQRCDVHLRQYPEPGSRRQRRHAHTVGWKIGSERAAQGQNRGEA
jgi:hypothetical protein